MPPIVTVIIPVAEAHVQFLPQAIESVTKQTARGVAQVLVVNDTGKPLQVKGAEVIDTAGHEGQARGRNLAIEQVKTPFLMFLDADDLLVNVALETLLRAYASPAYQGFTYLYGDAYYSDAQDHQWYFNAPLYDRMKLFNLNLHNITTLLPTEAVWEVGGFDEEVKGWEDWEFYIRLGVNGFCGAKVPVPVLLYRQHTGISREAHRNHATDIITDVRRRYADFIEGRMELMACCGKNGKAAGAAQVAVANLPLNPPGDGFVIMEYTGQNTGAIPYRVGQDVYEGANTNEQRFVRVRAEHAPTLQARGPWRLVPAAALQARRPQALPPVNRAPVTPATVPVQASAVSIPPSPVSPNVSPAIQFCPDCNHALALFHGANGCQALVGDKPCGCLRLSSQDVTASSETKPEKPKRTRKVKA